MDVAVREAGVAERGMRATDSSASSAEVEALRARVASRRAKNEPQGRHLIGCLLIGWNARAAHASCTYLAFCLLRAVAASDVSMGEHEELELLLVQSADVPQTAAPFQVNPHP